MKHMGNMTITKENALSFPAVSEFYGHLTITGAHLVAPNLQKVRGWVTITDGGYLEAESLGSVEGWLTVVDSNVNTPNLTNVGRDLTLSNIALSHDLTKVKYAGNLIIGVGTVVDVPALETVGGGVSVRRAGHLDSPVLTHITGSITLGGKAVMCAEKLQHIGGFYDAEETAKLAAPAFISV